MPDHISREAAKQILIGESEVCREDGAVGASNALRHCVDLLDALPAIESESERVRRACGDPAKAAVAEMYRAHKASAATPGNPFACCNNFAALVLLKLSAALDALPAVIAAPEPQTERTPKPPPAMTQSIEDARATALFAIRNVLIADGPVLKIGNPDRLEATAERVLAAVLSHATGWSFEQLRTYQGE